MKEYVDNGYSGTRLDRPALEELRRDVKTDLFDAVYFLDTDRIARDVAYQTIILGELIKHGKRIIIKGKDYVNNPENKFTVTVLGAVAELERAKIIERTTRGRLHRLRMGELSSNGHRIYGYHYVKKSPAAPAALVINEEQAPVVRSIFEMFASGRFGLVTISRSLEERRVPTRMGRPQWNRNHIKSMLRNETYAGTRYFNRITAATEASREGKELIRGARVEVCADFDAKRQFLLGHVERVIYNRYEVMIVGSVPVQSASGPTKLQFRIEGEIDQKAVRSRPRTGRPEDGWKEWKEELTMTGVATWPNLRSECSSGRAEAML